MNTKTIRCLIASLLLALGFLALTPLYSRAETPIPIQWQTNFGNGDTQTRFSCLQQTSDGGCIVGGTSHTNQSSGDPYKTSPDYGGFDYWVVKLDANGNKLWENTFGGDTTDQLRSVQQTSDGGYILAGYSDSGVSGNKTNAGFGSVDCWIVKLDSSGNKMWDKSFGGAGYDQANCIRQTSDGGYIFGGLSDSGVSGNKTNVNYGNYDAWLVRLDADGNKLWDKAYGGNGSIDDGGDNLISLRQTSDGGYILGANSSSGVSGNKTSAHYGESDYWVIRVDADGNKLWENSFGGNKSEVLSSIQQTSDGGYIVGGYTYSTASGNKTSVNFGSASNPTFPGYDCWIVRLNASGTKLWEKEYGGYDTGANDILADLQQTSDSNYIFIAQSDCHASGNKTSTETGTWVVRLDANGDKRWETVLDTPLSGFGSCVIQQTSANGYIVGYDTLIFAPYREDFRVIRLLGTDPLIIIQPSNQTKNLGTTATFTVVADGTAPLSYQWLSNGVPLTGKTDPSLVIPSVVSAHAASYSVRVSNISDVITSAVATLTVLDPFITTQPASRTNAIGTAATFTVVAGGTGTLTYQWKKNGVNIGSATGSSYSIGSVAASDVAVYSVTVSGSLGQITSAYAALSLPSPFAFFEDDFESGNLSKWFSYVSTPMGIDSTRNVVPGGGTYSARFTNDVSRMFRNVAVGDNGGVELNGHMRATSYLYDTGSSTRTFFEMRGHSGTNGPINVNGHGGDTAGSLSQLIAMGKNNTVTLAGEVFNGSKYQARAGLSTNAGTFVWFNLDASGSPNRSAGWHKFAFERMADNTNYNFYVDDILSRSLINITAVTLEEFVMGSGLSVSTNGGMDGAKIELFHTPVVITSHPVSRNTNAGTTVTFTVAATGDGLTYQWLKNGSPLPNGGKVSGATTATLTLSYVWDEEEAVYTAIVTGTGSAAASTSATLALATGVSYTWNGSTSDWTNAVNWTPNGVPRSTDAATVNSGTADIAISTTVSNLNLGSSGGVSGAATMTVSNLMNWTGGNLLTSGGRTVIAPGATLNLGSAGGVGMDARALENAGTIIWTGAGQFLVNSGSVISNRSGAQFSVQNDATLTTSSGATPRFDNAGTFVKSSSAGTTTINIPFNNYGLVDVQSGTVNFAVALQNETSGMVSGNGTISGGVVNNGTVSPGASPGLLTIAGNYTQTANGVLDIELAGTIAGTNYDRIEISGAATLAGTLNVTLTGGFYPAASAVFTFLVSGSRSGTFDTVNHMSADVGLQASYTATNAAVQILNVRPSVPVIGNQNPDEVALFSLPVGATDDDTPTQTLSYALTNSPSGASVDSSGVITWTPTEADGPMTTNITVRVTDNGSPNLTVSRTFGITVNEVNVAPVPDAIGNQTVNLYQTNSFTATATDADVPTNALSFSLINPPAGATITSGGLFSWQPALVYQAGTTNQVKIRVTDDGTPSLSSTGSVTVIVNPIEPVVLTALDYTNDQFRIAISGPTGLDYTIMTGNFGSIASLTNWADLTTTNPSVTPFLFIDSTAPISNRAYRVRLGP